MPAHAAALPAWIQKYISHRVFSKSPWQSILDCYVVQETGQGERCGPATNVYVAQILKLIFKIENMYKNKTE